MLLNKSKYSVPGFTTYTANVENMVSPYNSSSTPVGFN